MNLRLVVISPEKKVLEMDCLSVTLPTVEGEITILPKHTWLFSLLKPGEIIAKSKNEEISLAVGGGFVNVGPDKVTVLPEFGIKTNEIDEEKVKEAKQRAEDILKNKLDEEGSALAQASLARSLLELKIVQKRRKRL